MPKFVDVIFSTLIVVFACVGFFLFAMFAAIFTLILNPMIWAIGIAGTIAYLLLVS